MEPPIRNWGDNRYGKAPETTLDAVQLCLTFGCVGDLLTKIKAIPSLRFTKKLYLKLIFCSKLYNTSSVFFNDEQYTFLMSLLMALNALNFSL
jgi:hypothetical protein